MSSIYSQFYRFIYTALWLCLLGIAVAGQPVAIEPEEGSSLGFYAVCFVVIAILGAGLYVFRKSQGPKVEVPESKYNYQMSYGANDSYDMDANAEKDLEWLRKAKPSTSKNDGARRRRMPEKVVTAAEPDEINIDTRAFQEKMRKLQYSQLPINSFSQLAQAKRYEPLPVSDDHSLLTAIEQVNEEYEEDESVRDVALRVLTAFRFRNSIEAIAQIALYDLSSNLRSRAVTTLADFDHESVFETILLACADPTREVRAAAARGLFRLSFDRAHAWKRIIEANDEFRMSHAARAAVESGIVAKSFDRLVHEDAKIAYEAFALVSLLIKAGETDVIFEALLEHKDERIKYALLHVLKVQKDERTLVKLSELRIGRSWPADVSDRIRDAMKSVEQLATWSGSEI